MTDRPAPPPRDPDEIASDLVDGLLPPDEAARAHDDPAIRARVDQIQQARAALRAVPPADPGATDHAIASALDAFEALSAGAPEVDEAASAPPPPIPFPHRHGDAPPSTSPSHGWPAQHHPSHRHRSIPPWLAAAAAIVVVVLLAVGLLTQGNGDDEDTAARQASDAPTAAEEGESDSGGAGSGGVPLSGDGSQPQAPQQEAGSATDDAAPTSAAPTLPYLGDVTSATDLATQVRATQASTRATPAPSDQGGASPPDGTDTACPGFTDTGDPTRGTPTFAADATLDGTPIKVHVYDQNGQHRLVATDPSCTTVIDEPFDP